MNNTPNDSIMQVYLYIKIFEEKYKKSPNRAIANYDTLGLLKGNSMLIPNSDVSKDKSYTGFVLNNENNIKNLGVYLKEKLPKKEKSKLEELLKGKEIEAPLILSCKKNHYYVCDLSLSDSELNKLINISKKQ